MSEEKDTSREMHENGVQQGQEDETLRSEPVDQEQVVSGEAKEDIFQESFSTHQANDAWEDDESFVSQEIPPGVKGWNWGAFTYNIFWGVGNKTYLPLLCLIPIFNIAWVFVCGAKGNEWAWKKGDYTSVEDFRMVQKTWNRAGIVNVIVSLIASVVFFILYFLILAWGVAVFSGNWQTSHYMDQSYYMEEFQNGWDDDGYTYEEGKIDDIPKWSEKVFDEIEVATEVMDDQTNELTFVDGTTYDELVKIVGEPHYTYRNGDFMEVDWESDGNADVYAFVTITYDTKSRLIVDKSINGQ